MPINTTPAIELKDVSFRYNGIPLFRSISFHIAQGEYAGIIGPNGSGKTTLLKLMLGILKPFSGTVRILGQDVQESSARERIGYVPQRITQLDFSFPATVEEIVRSGRTPLRKPSDNGSVSIERALAETNMLELRNRRIDQLSGGERQRAFIARALAADPAILILDEPTVGVDAESQVKFYEFLTEMNEKRGITIIFVSHDTHALMKNVKCVLCLQEGELCQCAPGELHSHDHIERHFGAHGGLTHHAHV
ncbi:MAG: znuC3 [Candidatus Peribacteria bacterium]|nr:znuC3 [Candidatus Peribacteria bacterium]